MEIITGLAQLHTYDVPCVVALGTFDGVHRGHVDVILAAKKEAERTGAKLAVFTFSNHPYACFRPNQVPPALITTEQKIELMKGLGVDVLVDVPFDMSIARLNPEQFLERLQALGYSCLVVGNNFTYGLRGSGNVETLAASARKYGFKLLVRELVSNGQIVISSTEIRGLIAVGKVEEANAMLGRTYELSGTVAHGNERGRLLNFRTANLELVGSKLTVPLVGVYAVRVYIEGDDKTYGGMANIGKNPTFGDVADIRLETHIFDFAEDIYGKHISIAFVKRIRGEVKFAGMEALRAQLEKDKENCRQALSCSCQKM